MSQQQPQGWTAPPQQQPQVWGAPQPEKPKKKHRFLKVLGGIVAFFIVLGVVASLGDDGTTTTSTEEPAAAAPAKQDGPAADEPIEEEPAEPEPQSGPPVKYQGTGDKILTITKPDASGVGFAAITHKGSSNFVVETVEGQELLVNEIGNYSGRVMFDIEQGQDSKRLKITADGAWTVTTLPLERLPRFDGKMISGDGDDVVVYTEDAELTAAITHKGSANFVVQAHGGDNDIFSGLLINEIGNYSGEQIIAAASVLQITADGTWTIKGI